MCGIFGIYDFTHEKPVEKNQLLSMGNLLVHRGPDVSGYYNDTYIGIGINRLRIIDLETGDQPVFNENENILAVLNGEIYNYRELRADLLNQDHTFKSKSDSEVIVHLYETAGNKFVSQLNGMFAIAIWDSTKQKLILARDPLGIKPLYYCIHSGRFLFASEIKAILNCDIPLKINPQAISDYLSFNYIPEDSSIFSGVNKLPAGHILECSLQGVKIQKYWEVPFGNGTNVSPSHLLQKLKQSVQRHLISDVPLGITLSGGIDSSAITLLAQESKREQVKTFSIGFTEPEQNEFNFSRIIAKDCNTDHYELEVSPENYINRLPWIVWHLDEPLADPNALALSFLAALARQQGIIVLLSGEGSDEIFGGYDYYRDRLRAFKFREYYQGLPGFIKNLTNRFIPGDINGNKLQRLLRRMQSEKYSDIFRSMTGFFSGQIKRDILTNEFKKDIDIDRHNDVIESLMQNGDHPLERMLYSDMKLWLPGDLLAKGDKTTMAASVELRVPFLDKELVETASRIHPNQKINGKTNKFILKRSLSGLLPASIIDRRKMGFPVPFNQWLRGPMNKYASEQLLNDRFFDRDIFDYKGIKNLWETHNSGQTDNGSILWSLLILEIWFQMFVDKSLEDHKNWYPDKFTKKSGETFEAKHHVGRWMLDEV